MVDSFAKTLTLMTRSMMAISSVRRAWRALATGIVSATHGQG